MQQTLCEQLLVQPFRSSLPRTSRSSITSVVSIRQRLEYRQQERICRAPLLPSRHVMRLAAASVAAEQELLSTVDVDLGERSYPIYIGRGILQSGELLRKHVPGKRVLVVTNDTIAPLYLERYVCSSPNGCYSLRALEVHPNPW